MPAIHPAELTLRDTLDRLELSSGGSLLTHVLLSGFNWAEREEAERALEIRETAGPYHDKTGF
jgi:hypothetical protein